MDILNQNPAGCFAYDAEVDTLVQGMGNKNFGGFSDLLRKAFQHEQHPRQRKGEGESYMLDNPRLALLLSGTRDQFKKLIPSEENGLFSRMLYYVIPDALIQYKPPDGSADPILEKIQSLQSHVMEAADLWSGEMIHLKFNDEQERRITEQQQDLADIHARVGGSIQGSWFRVVTILKRICVTLAALEGAGEGDVPEKPFRAALAMFPVIKAHILQALDVIREDTKGKISITQTIYQELKGQGLTDEEISRELKCSRRTLARKKAGWM